MRGYEFTVVIERDEDGRFVAICPALQGCYTEGETEEEARRLIEDAIRLHVESRIARDEPIYEEVGSHKVRVAVCAPSFLPSIPAKSFPSSIGTASR